ncbi:hypothetical protein IAD21_01081 [Abditibacteriota bacterium]|nr:hypothetical protein IAD21_01081 [Abditibacteriota bacterium]
MSILLSDYEFAELRGRVTALETLLRQVEANKQFQPTLPPLPSAPATHLAPPSAQVVSPPPVTPPADWPSHWSPPSPSQEKLDALRAEAEKPQPKTEVQPVQEAKPQALPTEVAPVQQKVEVTPAQAPQPQVEPARAQVEHARIQEKAAPPPPEEPSVWRTPPSDRPFPFSPVPEPPQPTPEKSLLDWENLIGGRLALWVGALCLFLALASLLVYVGKTLPSPTPAMRVAGGFLGSFTLFALAMGARKRAQRWFVDGLLGLGLAAGFLSVWGGGPHFDLWPLSVSLLGFGFYSAAGIALAERRDSQALLILSSIGGFLTPVLVRHNNAQQLAFVFLSYLLVLNTGIVTVCVRKKWREIIYGAFVATVVIVSGWATEANIETIRPMLWVFATLGWGLFVGASCFRPFVRRERSEIEDTPLLLSATGIYAAASQWLLFPLMKGFPGAFSLGLTLVLGSLWWLSRRRIPEDEAFQLNFLALACVAGTLFVPIQFGQSGLVWGWAAQSVALLFIARKTNNTLLLYSSRTLWGLALVALAGDFVSISQTTASPLDAFSLRVLFCLAATAVSLWDEKDENWIPIYGLLLSWGGAYWLGRTASLTVTRLALVAPKHTTEAALLLGASAIAFWSLLLWRMGLWRRQSLLRSDSWLLLVLCLCTIAGVGLWSNAPLVGLRIAAFAIGAISLVTMGFWHARHEEGGMAFSHESVSVATAIWLALGMSIEVAARWHGGTFALPAMGTTAWFALCATWSLFAAGTGAISLWRVWPKMWALAETMFAVSISFLLFQSLLVPDTLTPIANMRLGAFVVAWLVALLARHVDGDSPHSDWWLLALSLLPLWATTQELWNGVAANHAYFGPEWRRFASLSVSLCWSFYAMLCLIIGVARRVQNLRIGALSLGALAVCKVFLFDLAFLDSGLRILSLGGLGAALLFISWLYSRFVRTEDGATA